MNGRLSKKEKPVDIKPFSFWNSYPRLDVYENRWNQKKLSSF